MYIVIYIYTYINRVFGNDGRKWKSMRTNTKNNKEVKNFISKKYSYIIDTDPKDVIDKLVSCKLHAGDILIFRADIIYRYTSKVDEGHQYNFFSYVSKTGNKHVHDDDFICNPNFFHNLDPKKKLKENWVKSNVCSEAEFDIF